MPEGRIHRRLSELIAAAAGRGLGDGWEVDSNLNWYPDDHGTAMAPDVMELPTGVETIEDPDAGLSSYRQDKNGGPAPKAVVEIIVPERYVHLGVDESPQVSATRHGELCGVALPGNPAGGAVGAG